MKKVPLEIEAEIIRLHFGERMQIGEIAGLIEVHHSVVRRVLQSINVPAPSLALRACKVDGYRDWIRDMLAKYPKIKASRLFSMVQERGYEGGVSRLREFVRSARPRPQPEAFLRLTKLPGEEAQVDWGHFKSVTVGRATRPIVMFAVTLAHSRAIYLRFYHDARMANFQAGHVRAFRFLGGVPRILLYDNLKSAVLDRVGNLITFNPALLEVASHYRFEPRAAKQARGSDKGRVERTIRYVRDSFYAAREFTTLEALNADALKWCLNVSAKRRWVDDRDRLVQEVWDEERTKLIPLPCDDFAAHHLLEVSVGKTPYFRYDRNDYSVPSQYVRQRLTVIADDQYVRAMGVDGVIAEHRRSFSKGETIENPQHIADLVTWKRKSGETGLSAKLFHAAPSTKIWLEIASKYGYNIGFQSRRLHELLLVYGADDLESSLKQYEGRESLSLVALQKTLDEYRRARGLSPDVTAVSLPSKRLENVVVQPHDLKTYGELEKRDEEEQDDE
jgi:transposase